MIDDYAANLAWSSREARLDYQLGPLMSIGQWGDEYVARTDAAIPNPPPIYPDDLENIVARFPPTRGYEPALSIIQHYQYSTLSPIQCRVTHKTWIPLPSMIGVVSVDTLIECIRDHIAPKHGQPPVLPEPVAPAIPRRLQFGVWRWQAIFFDRPYTVVGTPDWTHRWDTYLPTAREWLEANQQWLTSTYEIEADKWLADRVADAISNIERERLRSMGVNVGQ